MKLAEAAKLDVAVTGIERDNSALKGDFILANGSMSSNQSGEGKIFLHSREELA